MKLPIKMSTMLDDVLSSIASEWFNKKLKEDAQEDSICILLLKGIIFLCYD